MPLTDKEERNLALTHDVSSPEDLVMQYFIAGGKIHPDALQAIWGKGARGAKITEQKRAYLWAFDSKAPTLDRLAERLVEDYPEGHPFHDTDVKSAIEDVLNSYARPTDMARELNYRYKQQEELRPEDAEADDFISSADRAQRQEPTPDPVFDTDEAVKERKGFGERPLTEPVPFQKGERNFKTITKEAYNALLDKLKKAFPVYSRKGMIVSSEEDLRAALERNGIAWDDFINDSMKNTPFAKQLRAANEQFNNELLELTEDNANSKILWLGSPSSVLTSAGIADKPIKLYGNKVVSKAKKHGFSISDLKDLPRSVADPVAVFEGNHPNSHSILTEVRIDDKNVLVSIEVGKDMEAELNIVTSVYGKNDNSVVKWINEGKTKYLNKEKALDYLRISAPIAEAQNNERLSATKIIQDFENPISDADAKQVQFQALTPSRKEKQFIIINERNPAPNDYNTWIRSADDILTADEAFKTAFSEGEMYPDFTVSDMQQALKTGEITVYSSKPIEEGGFVTPSRMNAEEYAGGKGSKIYAKKDWYK